MPSFLDRRRTLGGGLTLAGAAVIAATLVVTGPAKAVSAQSTGAVFLTITLSDTSGGQFPAGGTVTVNAAVTNSAASGVGDATPTVTVSYTAGTLSFLGNGGNWTCTAATNAGQQVCTDGSITAGGATTLPVSFSVTSDALVGDGASVEATVNDGAADINSGSFSGQDSATDSATIAAAGSYTKDVPSGAYPSKVGGDQTVGTASETSSFTFVDGGVTIHLVVPPGALGPQTHISVYKGSQPFWNGSLSSSSQAFVDGYAAAWTDFDENQPAGNAASPITMIVSDGAVHSTDTLYRATTSGVGTKTGVVGEGAWTVSFTEDPGFVLAQAAAAPTSSSSSSSPAATTTVSPPPTGGGPATRGGGSTLPIGAGVLLFVAGVVVLGTGRRRQNG